MDERAAWDLFWSYDRLSSFGTGKGSGNYGDAIASGWRAFFASLPDGSRVLDLCTGNGAVAVIAVEAGDGLNVTGVDLASVKPAVFVSNSKDALGKIEFLGNTPAESLPLDNASFDTVVSQYGIEYSNLERSLPEAVRVLAPGGSLRFACHAAEGSVARETKRSIGDADFLLDEAKLFDHAEDAILAIVEVERGRARSPFAPTEAQTKYGAFREALRSVADRTRFAADAAMLASVHRSLTDLFQQRQGLDPGDIAKNIGALRTEVQAHRERQRQLLAAALSAEQVSAIAGQLSSLGLADIQVGRQDDGSDLVGHLIEARSVE